MIAKNKKTTKTETIQNIFFSAFILILFLGTTAFLIYSSFTINQRREKMGGKIESLQKELQALEEEKARLESGINQTQSDVYWEEKLREQGYKKPGEEAVVVLPPEDGQQSSEKPKSFWEKVLEKLHLRD